MKVLAIVVFISRCFDGIRQRDNLGGDERRVISISDRDQTKNGNHERHGGHGVLLRVAMIRPADAVVKLSDRLEKNGFQNRRSRNGVIRISPGFENSTMIAPSRQVW